MWIAENWEDYQVLDASGGEKLERWGNYILVRPDPQVIWDTPHSHRGWKTKNGHYHRSTKGGGEWEFFDLPEEWAISYRLGRRSMPAETGDPHGTPSCAGTCRENGRKLLFHLKPLGFKHTGLFPEQAVNWEWCHDLIRAQARPDRPFRVLNLFAYTGGATLAAAAAGAHVTHVDASKGMVAWARENAVSSGLGDAPVRWLVDDCVKFVERELRRGNRYEGIIMDPPSYGRGPKGETWKLEENLWSFLSLAVQLLSRDARFLLINSYTTGLQPAVLSYLLHSAIPKQLGGNVAAAEIGLPVAQSGLVLPCGASGRWQRS